MDTHFAIKKLITRTLVMVAVCVFIVLLAMFTNKQAETLEATAQAADGSANKLSELNLQIAQQDDAIQKNKIKLTSETNDMYLVMLSELAKSCNANITKLQTLPSESVDGTTLTLNKIEIRATLKNILLFQNSLQNSKAARIKNLSLRQSNKLLWLVRDFDNIEILPWLEFEKKEGEDEPPLTDDVEEDVQKAEEQIDIAQLFNQEDMLCYFEIEYYN